MILKVLRELFEKRSITSFAASCTQSTASSYEHIREGFQGTATPSWEYYHTAAEEEVPEYRAELAKSDRSACRQESKIGNKCGEARVAPQGHTSARRTHSLPPPLIHLLLFHSFAPQRVSTRSASRRTQAPTTEPPVSSARRSRA